MTITENNPTSETLPIGSTSESAHVTATEQTVEHEHTLYAETIWHGKYFSITNSMINAWIVVLIVIMLSLALRRKIKLIPTGLQNYFEAIVDAALNLADTVTGSRDKTLKFFPICFALFVFVLINNWLGILPGVGSIGFNMVEDGHKVFVPLFRGGTADLNTTLALALIAVVGSNLAGAIFVGSWNYLNKFINIKAVLAIPGRFLKEPTIILVNPIKAFVGIVEIIGEAAKVASLSFRLFGNIFAGEVLLASMAALIAFVIPIPFMFLEIIVGIIQALIFSVLTLVYLTIATTKEEH
jgi:F-type H+-transporting ATPase subunit a